VTTFRALFSEIDVRIDSGVALSGVIEAIIKPYPRTDRATLRYAVEPRSVRRNDKVIVVDDPQDVVPLFELDLYEQVVARAEPGWLLHAAAVEVNGRALVLSGRSGAGKTTLALALAARGHRLLTEEIVWIGSDQLVRGLPRALHVLAGSSPPAQILSDWEQVDYPLRARDSIQQSRIFIPPPSILHHGALPLGAIVHIGHGPSQQAILETCPPREGLHRLWNLTLRDDDAGLQAATTALRSRGCFELSSTSISEALTLLEPLLK
jgi:hypothetical protein